MQIAHLRPVAAGLRNSTILLCLFVVAIAAHASATLLMEEPYGGFGAMNPTGHAAIYLNHVCADSPTTLRSCHDGEYGVVISRYYKVGRYDWIAIPLVPYLYAVDSVSDIPATVDKEQVLELRDAYRRMHLLEIVPDDNEGGPPKGNWYELIGASFDRKIYGFQIDSTAEQDQTFIDLFNDRRNKSHFNLLFHNCADFSSVALDVYLPHSIHRNFIADVGLMTPKQLARSLIAYSRKYPALNLFVFVIPQVPGSVPRSHPIRGVTDSLIMSKKYLVPLIIVSPEATGAVALAYLIDGRLKLPKTPPVFDIDDNETSGTPDTPATPLRTVLPLHPAQDPGSDTTPASPDPPSSLNPNATSQGFTQGTSAGHSQPAGSQ
jgi:hypothetical protein